VDYQPATGMKQLHCRILPVLELQGFCQDQYLYSQSSASQYLSIYFQLLTNTSNNPAMELQSPSDKAIDLFLLLRR
jgi:hypothetical protein